MGRANEGDSTGSGHRGPAPGDLPFVQAFVNTNDIEGGDDQLRGPAELSAWLARRGLTAGEGPVSDKEWRRAIAVREGLRALAASNNDLPVDTDALHALDVASGELRLIPRLHTESRWRLEPRAGNVDGSLERVLAIVVAAMADGTWERVKVCQADSCRWLFYDHSGNRSRTWCTMAICGARAKARAYRARKRRDGGARREGADTRRPRR
jgi:predicted RNA-binding Zn ribbon-like protein